MAIAGLNTESKTKAIQSCRYVVTGPKLTALTGQRHHVGGVKAMQPTL